MERASWSSIVGNIQQQGHYPHEASIVPEGEGTLSDRDLGVVLPSSSDYRASGSNFEGAPHGSVIVDAASKKRRGEYKPVALKEMLRHEQEDYCESEEYSSEDSEEYSKVDRPRSRTPNRRKRKRSTSSQDDYNIEDDDLIVSNGEEGSSSGGVEIPDDVDVFVDSDEEGEERGRDAFFVSNARRPLIPETRASIPLSALSENQGSVDWFSESQSEEDAGELREGVCRTESIEDEQDGVCPLCVYGNTDYDKVACEKAAVMWDVLGVAFFSMADSRGASVVVSTYWNTEISGPSHKRARKARKRGKIVKPIPHLEVDQVETHITEHMGDPRVYLGVSIERNRKLERLLTDFCFERTGDGDVRPNLSVLNQLRLLNKHTMDLYKQDPREMFGYCDSWTANPKDINRFINLSRCKVTTQQDTTGTG